MMPEFWKQGFVSCNQGSGCIEKDFFSHKGDQCNTQVMQSLQKVQSFLGSKLEVDMELSCSALAVDALVSGFALHKIISSELKSYQPIRAYVIWPIPRSDPIPDSIISSDSTQGCQPEQLYSSSDTVGTPQLDL